MHLDKKYALHVIDPLIYQSQYGFIIIYLPTIHNYTRDIDLYRAPKGTWWWEKFEMAEHFFLYQYFCKCKNIAKYLCSLTIVPSSQRNFAFSRKTFELSRKTKNICSQNYYVSPRNTAFSRITIVFPEKHCILLQKYWVPMLIHKTFAFSQKIFCSLSKLLRSP